VTMQKGIRLIALVGPIGDKKQTIHKVGLPNGPQTVMPFPEVLLLETEESSFMLYRYTVDGQFCGDTWHQTLEEAKNQAEFEYGRALGPWLLVPEAEADGHEYAISYAKTQREAV
jgi:hypothetical protein